eukprot:491732_1
MKPRRGSKPRHKFKFTLTVNHITFPKHITRRLSSSKFYILLNRADKSTQTKIGSLSKSGKIEYNECISLEATLLKNRSSNIYISKHCRIVLRQIKNSSLHNPNAKIRESSVGSIKFDLVDYIDRIPSQQQLTFTKCALPDVFISFTIESKELEIIQHDYETDMSVTSANTIGVDSFWLDDTKDSEGNEIQCEGDSYRDRKEIVRLTDDNLMEFGNGNSRQKDMAKFRIKHAMDIMANESDSDLYYRITTLEKVIISKELSIKHFNEEERKWNKYMIEWEREKSNFEASTIELNLKYQQEKQKSKNCKKELNEIRLNMKRIIICKEKIENKYNNLVQSLARDKNELLVQLSEQQRDYDDLEESLVRQQNSWRDTANILENELEKKKRKYVKLMNELKKYKTKCYGFEKENGKLGKKIEYLQKEVYKMKNENIAIKNGEEYDSDKGMKKRRNSSVMNAVKKFNSVNVSQNQKHGYGQRKRRKSGKLKRKSVSGIGIDEKENNLRGTNCNGIGPVLIKMGATKLSSVKNMIHKIEKEENIMIEQELLQDIDNEGGNNNYINELKDVSNVIQINNVNDNEEFGRNIDVSDDDNDFMNGGKGKHSHKHVRSVNSVNLENLGGKISDLGINFDELNAVKNNEHNLSEDEDNLSELSHSDNNVGGNEEIVQDID